VLVLVAGLNFVLGLLVGRGTSPIQFDIQALERELARLRDVELQAEIKRFRIAMEGEGDRSALDFYRDLKQDQPVRKPLPGPQTAAAPALPAPKPPPPAAKPAPVRSEAPPAGTEAVQAKSKPAPATTPPVEGKADVVPVKSAAAPARTSAVLQVAALREAQAAQRVESRLRAEGFAVRIVKAQVQGQGTWYRVRVGPFTSPEAIQDARGRLAKLNFKPIVINE
jgi:cell division protein FtsN